MTIASEVVPRLAYTGDGSQTSFPYPWLVLAAADLAVYQAGVLQTLGVHYTLSSVGAPTGGNVVFTIPPASGAALVFRRDTEATQNTTLSDTGPAGMVAIERALDRLTMLEQETRATVARAPLLDVSSATQNPTMADPVALGLLRWNSAGTGVEPVSAATILPSSATLPLAVTQGGTNAITALAARASLGVDGQVRKVLTNLTGGALAAGDVVAFDTATDSTVVLDDTVSSKAVKAIALATIAHAATGEFLVPNVTLVNVTGTVVRGRYLRKSATTKVAEDSGVLHGAATDPPAGAFGVALTGNSGGQVLAVLFGFTYPGNTSPTITGLSHVQGLTGANNAGTPDTQYDLAATAAVVRDPVGGGTLVLPTVATRTLNIATPGPAEGGRDEVAAFSANSWIYVYLIAKTDGTYHVTASLTPPPTGPAFPTDYTLWAYLGALRINNGSAIIRTRLRGSRALYDAAQAVVTDGRATVETAVSVASLVPPTAPTWSLLASGLNQRSSNQYVTLRVVTGTDYDPTGYTGVGTAFIHEELTLPNLSQQFFYQYAADPTAGYGLHAYVRGYENPS